VRKNLPKIYYKGVSYIMDDSTRKRLERNKLKEFDCDCTLAYIQYYKEEEMKLTFQEIIEFIWKLAYSGVCRWRCKELFIENLCLERMNCEEFKHKEGDNNE
jgi:hypothetical protein